MDSSSLQAYYEVPAPRPNLPPRPRTLAPVRAENEHSGNSHDFAFPPSNDNTYEAVPDLFPGTKIGVLDYDDNEIEILKAKAGLIIDTDDRASMEIETYNIVPDPLASKDVALRSDVSEVTQCSPKNNLDQVSSAENDTDIKNKLPSGSHVKKHTELASPSSSKTSSS